MNQKPMYYEMQGISQTFKPEKISTKLGVTLYGRAKIKIFPTE